MFQLENQTCKISNVNLRAELHGEETKVAVDLKFDMKLSNDVLSYFDPTLKSSLYGAPSEAMQGELVQREITLSLYPPSAEDQLKQELAGMDGEDEE